MQARLGNRRVDNYQGRNNVGGGYLWYDSYLRFTVEASIIALTHVKSVLIISSTLLGSYLSQTKLTQKRFIHPTSLSYFPMKVLVLLYKLQERLRPFLQVS